VTTKPVKLIPKHTRNLCRSCGRRFRRSRVSEEASIACDAEKCQAWAASYREALRSGAALPPEYGMSPPQPAQRSTKSSRSDARAGSRRDRPSGAVHASSFGVTHAARNAAERESRKVVRRYREHVARHGIEPVRSPAL